MPEGDRWKAGKPDLWVLGLLFLLVLWTFRGIVVGTHEPFMSSMRTFEPWKSNLTEEDQLRRESFADDSVLQTYAWAVYAHEHLREGDFPLWNTRMFCGTPFTANRLTGLFDPLILIPVYLFEPATGLAIIYFIHYLLAAWFMYLFLKCLGLSRPAAVFGTIGYMLMGTYLPVHGFTVAGKAYMPMCFYYLERACSRRDRVGIIGSILSFNFLTITSYPQMSVFALYIASAWVLFSCGPGFLKAVKRGSGLIVLLVIAFLIGAMQHLPMFEFWSMSRRFEPQFVEQLSGVTTLEQFYSPSALLALMFPRLWGDYISNPENNLPMIVLRSFNHAYIGILPAFGFLFLGTVWKNRYARFFAIVSLIGLLSFIWQPFHDFLVMVLPAYRLSKIRAGFTTWTSMIIVSAFVFDYLLLNIRSKPSLTRGVKRSFLWFFGAVLGFAALTAMAYISKGDLASIRITCLWVLWGIVIAATASFLLFLYVRGKLHLKWLIVGIIALQIIDLLPYHEHFKPLIPKGRTCFVTPGIQFLIDKTREDGPFRIFRERYSVMPPNTPMLYDIDEMGGYDSFVSSDFVKLFGDYNEGMTHNERSLYLPTDYMIYTHPWWSYLGVRYLVSPTPMPRLTSNWVLAFDEDQYIYENSDWMPRWYLVPTIIPTNTLEESILSTQWIRPRQNAVVQEIDIEDIPPGLLEDESPDEFDEPVGELQVMFYGSNELRLSANCARDCYLVFADTFFPGWRAWIDDEEVEIYRTNGNMKGIVLPEGDHAVRFLYDPPLYKLGWWLCLAGWILLALLLKPMQKLFGWSKPIEQVSAPEQSADSPDTDNA